VSSIISKAIGFPVGGHFLLLPEFKASAGYLQVSFSYNFRQQYIPLMQNILDLSGQTACQQVINGKNAGNARIIWKLDMANFH